MHHFLTTSLLTSLPLTLAQSGTHLKWPFQSYKSFSWNAPVLGWSKPGPTQPVPGYLFFASISTDADKGGFDAPTIMTDEGELVWRSESGTVNGTRNFNMQNMADGTADGKDLLTYWTGNHNGGYGAVIMLDNTYQQAYNVCMADLPIIPIAGTYINQPCVIDSHESRITARGTLLAAVRNVTQADLTSRGGEADGYLLDSQFYDINITTQEVILRWSAAEHAADINMFKLSATKPGHKTSPHLPWDFFHMNSITDVPEPLGGYLVSSRYLSSVIKLDSQGNIEWYLDGANGGGNFSLPTNGNFSFQHCALSANVTSTTLQITMFDNSNKDGTKPKQESSGLEISVDLTGKTASLFRRVQSSNFTSTPHTGSYQSLPMNHVFVDYGSPPIFNEYDEDGNIVYEASASSVEGEVYRAYRKNFTAYPSYPPSVYTESGSSGNTTVYVSWNGATEVSSWRFASGTDCNSISVEDGTFARTGFETVASLPISGTHVQALAFGAEPDVVLGRSMLISAQGGNSSQSADGSAVISCSAVEAIAGLSTTTAAASATATTVAESSSSVSMDMSSSSMPSATSTVTNTASTSGAAAVAAASTTASSTTALSTGGAAQGIRGAPGAVATSVGAAMGAAVLAFGAVQVVLA